MSLNEITLKMILFCHSNEKFLSIHCAETGTHNAVIIK